MTRGIGWIAILGALAACGGTPEEKPLVVAPSGTAIAVLDSAVMATTSATGTASAIESATLSSKLMASVVEVSVLEGALVRRGDVLVRLDLRDLAAKRQQAEAGLADVQAQHDLALVSAKRMRALYADSAAPKAMLDAAEAGLARATAGVRAATAMLSEVAAVASYGELRAPFDGVVTQRFVDVGAFVAPGAPVVTVDRLGALRISVTIPAAEASTLSAGMSLRAEIEGDTTTATVEGVTRGTGGTYLVNAIVPNRGARFLAGSAAVLRLPSGTRRALLVPTAALGGEGDLVTVWRRTAQGDLLTLVRLGMVVGDHTEIIAGVTAGDSVVVPDPVGRP